MHKFRVLSEKAFSEIEEKFKQLEERLSKTEEALSKLENNVTDTKEDIEKLELIKMKIEVFNFNMRFTTDRIYLTMNDNRVDLVIRSFDLTSQAKIAIAYLYEPIDEIERRLNNQIQSIPFYHYFFVESRVYHFLEFTIEQSEDFIARIRLALDEYDDEIIVDLIEGNNIRVSYIRALNVDASQKLVFDENSSVRFELSILDIVDDYDEYRIKALASKDCRLNDFEDTIEKLRTEIELNEQLKRFIRQSEK